MLSGFIINKIINPKIENTLFNEEMEIELSKSTPIIVNTYLFESPERTKTLFTM